MFTTSLRLLCTRQVGFKYFHVFHGWSYGVQNFFKQTLLSYRTGNSVPLFKAQFLSNVVRLHFQLKVVCVCVFHGYRPQFRAY